jgi:hypothetical protein
MSRFPTQGKVRGAQSGIHPVCTRRKRHSDGWSQGADNGGLQEEVLRGKLSHQAGRALLAVDKCGRKWSTRTQESIALVADAEEAFAK